MPAVPILETPRLRLRDWRAQDIAPLAALNRDPDVMAYLGGPVARQRSDLLVGRFIEKWTEEPRFGWWVLERQADAAFLGFVGLGWPDFREAPAPCVEIGWRLGRAAWGQGYATEAARACLAHGFERVGLAEILAFTVPQNLRSRKVMTRLGMQHDASGDFDHPLVPEDSPLRRHVLYRLSAARWRRLQAG